MATHAKVTSLEAIQAFRAQLIVYLSRARRSIDEVQDELHRTRLWVEHDRRSHWEQVLRKREKQLDQAEQELLAARMKENPGILAVRQTTVRKARRAVEEAQQKLAAIKKVSRDFDNATAPRLKALDSFRQSLDFDLPKSVAYLEQMVRTLEDYGGNSAPPTSAPPSTPDNNPSDPHSSTS